MRVRIVDDEHDLARYLSFALEEEGFECETTTSRFAELLSPEPWEGIDAAVVDYMLPDITGLDILKYLKANHPTIRRILWTAVDSPKIENTADVVLVKPVGSVEIVRALKGNL